MKFDFDSVEGRCGTDSYKWDMVQECLGDYSPKRQDLLPMWVADMDFSTPPFVKRALARRMEQATLGYTCCPDSYREAIAAWCNDRYGWQFGPQCVNYIPGVVAGIFLAMLCFTEKGDRILIQDPVYHPFRTVPETNGRTIVRNSLVRTATGFEMDFDALERDIRGCRMMILCNPHNPAGICWSRETLERVADICHRNGVLVVSDEIHCDMILDAGLRHIPFATVSPQAAACCITLQAPSKTFNMPGIVCAQAIVTDKALRDRYFNFIHGSDQDLGNIFTFDCARACYSAEGNRWRRAMLDYVSGNIGLLEKGLAPVSDKISVIRPQASFLVFLDCRGMGLASALEYRNFFTDECGLVLNEGSMFGPGGLGYMRMNVGCSRSLVSQAVERILDAMGQCRNQRV